ncbi:hypothetical protein BGZ94_000061 [Podila epigama]|nr:hypothetical protein BGZ94_000061 [Podila epigama]
MGSDEDEPSTLTPSTRSSVPSRTGSMIKNNPVFQQLNARPVAPPLCERAPIVAPPAPQRPAPRPVSPQGPPPKLPSRSNSTVFVEDTPEEAERKHLLDKRRRVVQELLETEKSYSKDMLLLQEVYVTDMAASNLFTQADEKMIFTNLSDVISLTLDFIALLTPACGGEAEESYDDAQTFVGEAFIQMISRIRRVYSEYCKRQEASAQHLQELDQRREFKSFFEACTEKCKGKTTGWDLASLLIKPVQRVLKYPLLINQIHALTPPDHADHENLVVAQKEILQVAEEINEIKKRKDIVEKIVGSKKKNDSDTITRHVNDSHGFNKKFARTTQQLRQAVGGSDVTVDILFEALLEKFNLQQRLIREFVKHIQNWLISIKQYFDTQEAFAMNLLDIFSMVPIHRQDENSRILLIKEYQKSLSQFSKTIGRELENRLKKTVYRSIEQFLKLFSGPLQVMKKREKKLLDYDNVRGMKERGDTIDKNMLESANAYTAINEQLLDELPKFLGLTTQYFDLIVMEFSKVQVYFYQQVKLRNHEFFIAHIDSAARDLAPYLSRMNTFEDYVEAMMRPDGPVERMDRISLLRNVYSDHVLAFENTRDQIQKRRGKSSLGYSRSRSSSNATSPLPDSTSASWHSKSASQGAASETSTFEEQGMFHESRYYPGEDENPFEMPESIFHDESVASDEYEPFGATAYSSRSLSETSYYPSSEKEQSSQPPPLDMGLDADEIGIAQALFECTAIYPYQSNESRQLTFEAGENIIVFGMNDDWYFGKKVENRLCRLIVREQFGPIVEKVANVLLRKGRMPVGMIANITSMAPKTVRECLFVMIQHNFACYAESTENTRIVTYYEINKIELLNRGLIPKVLHSSQEWYDRDGGSIAQTLLLHGKLTITDCINDIIATASLDRRTVPQRTAALKKAFTKMVKEKCLIAVRPSDSLTGVDKDMAEEKREIDKMTLPPSAAALATIRRNLESQKELHQQSSTIVGLKRTLDSVDEGYEGDKRRRLDGDVTIVEEVETDVFFKINFERFIIRWRNGQIAEIYESRLNPTAKAIMSTILKELEPKMINCKEERSSVFNTMQLISNLPKDVNLIDTLEFNPSELGSHNSKPTEGECLEKYIQILEEDLLEILKRDSGRSGYYVVQLKTASTIMKKNLIQAIVSTRFGSPYVRIMNMLLDKGKLEEKQISKYAMMPVKDVREKLTTLCTFGVLNLQEVPKSNDRAPSRTFYLWEVILTRTADALVDRLYHTMGNLRQRRFVEKAKRAVLLAKCERTDVKADDSLLNATEKKELDTLNGILETLEVQEQRVGQMVLTLRDF